MNNWKYEKLSKLCIRIGDGLHGTPEYSEQSDIYFINGNNLKNGNIEINENTKKVSQVELNNNFIPLDNNSLLMSINGTLGNMSFYRDEKVMLGKSSAYLNFKTSINKFYYYYFQLQGVQEHFHNVATGSTIKNLSLKSIQDFEVPVPSENEWKKIAKVLSDLDAKIELNNKINAELEAMAKTLYDYWFVQFDFPAKLPSTSLRLTSSDIDAVSLSEVEVPYKTSGGKMVWNEELKREIPEGWEINSLSSLVDCNKWTIKKDNSFTEINYLDTSSLTNNVIYDIQKITCETEKVPSRAQRVISKNDILYSTVRPNQCHFGIIKDPMPNMIASTGFAQLRSKSKFVSNELIYTFLSSKIVTTRLQQIADTAVSAYPSISHNDILGLKIVLPHENRILLKTNSLLGDVFMKISLNQKENQQLASLRDWLLPMLMNGQVRVGDVEEVLRQAQDDILGMVAENGAKYEAL